jgi:hypothetical protein
VRATFMNGRCSQLIDRQNRTLAPGVVGEHVPLQNAEGSAMLYNILRKPGSFYEGTLGGVYKAASAHATRQKCAVTRARSPSASPMASERRRTKVLTPLAFRSKNSTDSNMPLTVCLVVSAQRPRSTRSVFLEVGAAPPIDMLPALKYLPGPLAPWKASSAKLRGEMKHFCPSLRGRPSRAHSLCRSIRAIRRSEATTRQRRALRFLDGPTDPGQS